MSPRARNILLIALGIIMAFGIGAAWQYMEARNAREQYKGAAAQLEAATREIDFERLESTLALATVAAQLGNFERGRQLASEFFTGLQEKAPNAPADAQPGLQALLQSRDAIITQLSRSDPASGLELSRRLAEYRQALGRDPAGLLPPAITDTARF
jgi:predicted negative regulator of RcsB-dependent stress response